MAVASGAYDCVLSTAVNINTCVPKPGFPPQDRGELDNDALWASIVTGVDAAYMAPTYGSVGAVEAILVKYAVENNLSYETVDEIFVNYLIGKRREALLNPKATRVSMTYEQEAKMLGFDNVKDYPLSPKFNPPMGTMVRARFLGQSVDAAAQRMQHR